MTDSDDVTLILTEWLDRRDRDPGVDPAELLAAHPEHAKALKSALEGLDLLDLCDSDSAPASMSIPERIGDYRIICEIGRGGMGAVFEAEQVSMDRRVALKVLTPSLTNAARSVKRFQREAKTAGRLHHTNIVPVHGMGREAGYWYYAMELVEGRPLSAIVEELQGEPRENRCEHALAIVPESSTSARRPSSTTSEEETWHRHIAGLFAGVAEALHIAHEAGVVHRDIKPSNLLLDADGSLKIVDFGLAHLETPGPSMTLTGDLVGTPTYMSPEQASAKRVPIDHRTDIYSLGATLYQVLTLRPPFEGRNVQELCSQIISKEPLAPRRIEGHIPRDLETIVLKAMDKERHKRYQRAADLAEDLRRFALGSAISARRVGVAERAWRKVKRHKVISGLSVAVLVLLMAFAVVWQDIALGRATARAARVERLLEVGYSELSEGSPQCAAQHFADARDLAPESVEAIAGAALAADRAGNTQLGLQILRDVPGEEARRLLRRIQLVLLRRSGADAEAERLEATIEPPRDAVGYFLAGIANFRCEARPEELEGAKEAAAMLERACRGTRRALYYDELAHAASHMTDVEFSTRVAESLIQLWPERAKAWKSAGRALQRADPARAVECFERSLEIEEVADVYRFLGDAHYRLRAESLAFDAYQRAVELDPQNILALGHMGLIKITAGEPEEGVKYAERAYRANAPLLADADAACYALGLIGLDRGDEALEIVRQELLRHPRSWRLLSMRVKAMVSVGLIDRAVSAAFGALDTVEPDLNLVDQMGQGLSKAGRHAEGIALAERALEAHPARLGLMCALAFAHRRADDEERAQAMFQQVVAQEPEHPSANREIGNTAIARGDFAEAERRFRIVTASHESRPSDWAELGFLMLQLSRPTESIEPYRTAITRKPSDPLYHCNLGFAQMQIGAFDEALAALTRGHELGTARPNWPHPSAQAVEECRRLAAGMAELKRILADERAPFASRDEAQDALEACKTAHLYAKAAELWCRMLDADPALLSEEPRGLHAEAAIYAVAAGTYTGDDHAAEPSAWRARARAWLEQDLTSFAAEVETGSRKPGAVIEALELWRKDGWLFHVREDSELARLPEAEAKQWHKLWADVRDTLEKAKEGK